LFHKIIHLIIINKMCVFGIVFLETVSWRLLFWWKIKRQSTGTHTHTHTQTMILCYRTWEIHRGEWNVFGFGAGLPWRDCRRRRRRVTALERWWMRTWRRWWREDEGSAGRTRRRLEIRGWVWKCLTVEATFISGATCNIV